MSKNRNLISEMKLKSLLLVVVAEIVLIGATVITNNPQRIKDFLNWGYLLPRPERYTELYFANHINLPEMSGMAELGFVIANQEGREISYNYEITASNGQRTMLLSSEQVKLVNNEQVVISKSVLIPESDKRVKVAINLLETNQSIHFWIN